MSRLVDFSNNADDFQAVLLGSLGFSTNCIASKTGLSGGQVIYRLGKAGVRRMDYRNGDTRIAGIVLQDMEEKAARQVRDHLKEQMQGRKRMKFKI